MLVQKVLDSSTPCLMGANVNEELGQRGGVSEKIELEVYCKRQPEAKVASGLVSIITCLPESLEKELQPARGIAVVTG